MYPILEYSSKYLILEYCTYFHNYTLYIYPVFVFFESHETFCTLVSMKNSNFFLGQYQVNLKFEKRTYLQEILFHIKPYSISGKPGLPSFIPNKTILNIR
jgi:hypothetical protein